MFDETSYTMGSKVAWLIMLRECLENLGIDDPEVGKARWVIERQEAVLALREICAEFGDNDWLDDLHLADVINKHLADIYDDG